MTYSARKEEEEVMFEYFYCVWYCGIKYFFILKYIKIIFIFLFLTSIN
jgi:hypothetical protein